MAKKKSTTSQPPLREAAGSAYQKHRTKLLVAARHYADVSETSDDDVEIQIVESKLCQAAWQYTIQAVIRFTMLPEECRAADKPTDGQTRVGLVVQHKGQLSGWPNT